MPISKEKRIILFPSKQDIQTAIFAPCQFRTKTADGEIIEEVIIFDTLHLSKKTKHHDTFSFVGLLIRGGNFYEITGIISVDPEKESFVLIKSIPKLK